MIVFKLIYVIYLIYIYLSHDIIPINFGVFMILLFAHGLDVSISSDEKSIKIKKSKHGTTYSFGLFFCDSCGEPNTWAECPYKIDCEKWNIQHCNTINCEEACII